MDVDGGLSQDETGKPMHVLIAEDNIFNLEILKCYLEDTNITFDWASNGQEAVQLYRSALELARKAGTTQSTFQAVLMDCEMPVMNGYTASQQIRIYEQKNPELIQKPVPILGVTANALRSDKEKCMSHGMDDYVTKPISKKQLLQLVHSWYTKTWA